MLSLVNHILPIIVKTLSMKAIRMTTALVKNVDVRNFIVRLMMRAGSNQTEATDLAKVLVDAGMVLIKRFFSRVGLLYHQ